VCRKRASWWREWVTGWSVDVYGEACDCLCASVLVRLAGVNDELHLRPVLG